MTDGPDASDQVPDNVLFGVDWDTWADYYAARQQHSADLIASIGRVTQLFPELEDDADRAITAVSRAMGVDVARGLEAAVLSRKAQDRAVELFGGSPD